MADGVEPRAARARRWRQLAGYGSLRTAAEGLLGARGVLLALVVGPEAFGAWNLFRLALQYGAFAELGVLRGLEREAVRAGAGGADGSAEQIAWGRAAVAWVLFTGGILTVAAALGTLVPAAPALVLGGVAAAIVLDRLFYYGLAYVRAADSLRAYARVEIATMLCQATLTLALALVWGLPGAFTGYVLASAIGVAHLARCRVPFRPAWSRPRWRSMLRVGFPLSLTMVSVTLLATADRLIVGALGGLAMLGLYGFAAALASLGTTLGLVVRTVMLKEVYGSAERGAAGATRTYLGDTLAPFAIWTPMLAGLAALVLEPLLLLVAPQYAASTAAARLFLFTGVLQGLTGLAALAVVVGERQAMLPALSLLGLALNVGGSVLALTSGWGLEAVAAAALLARAVYSAGVLRLAAAVAAVSAPGRFVARLLLPTLWCAAVVAALSRLGTADGPESFAFLVAVYLVTILPLALLVRRTSLRAATRL